MIFPGFLLTLVLISPGKTPLPAFTEMFGHDFETYERSIGKSIKIEKDSVNESRLYILACSASVVLSKETETTAYGSLIAPTEVFVNVANFSWPHGLFSGWKQAFQSIGLDPLAVKATWFNIGDEYQALEGARLSGMKGVRSARWVPKDPQAGGKDTLELILSGTCVKGN